MIPRKTHEPNFALQNLSQTTEANCPHIVSTFVAMECA